MIKEAFISSHENCYLSLQKGIFFLFSLWRDQLASHQAPPVKSLVQLRLKRQTNSRSSVNFTRPHLCSPQRTTECLPCQTLRTLLWRKKILRFKSFLECLGLTHTDPDYYYFFIDMKVS